MRSLVSIATLSLLVLTSLVSAKVSLAPKVSLMSVPGWVREFLISTSSGDWKFDSHFKLLNAIGGSFLYFHPELARDMLMERERYYTDYGMLLEGGPIAGGYNYIAITTQQDDGVVTTSYVFDSQGRITRATYTKKTGREDVAISKSLLGFYSIAFPNLGVPEVSRGERLLYGLLWRYGGILSHG